MSNGGHEVVGDAQSIVDDAIGDAQDKWEKERLLNNAVREAQLADLKDIIPHRRKVEQLGDAYNEGAEAQRHAFEAHCAAMRVLAERETVAMERIAESLAKPVVFVPAATIAEEP